MPWREEKQEILQSARRILVKAGSAVLTNSEGLDRQAIANLVDQITDLHKRGIYTVLVTSGAAAAGRAVLKGRTEVRGIPDRQAAAAVGQSRLMHWYDEMFAARGITAAQILLTREVLRDRQKLVANHSSIEDMQERGEEIGQSTLVDQEEIDHDREIDTQTATKRMAAALQRVISGEQKVADSGVFQMEQDPLVRLVLKNNETTDDDIDSPASSERTSHAHGVEKKQKKGTELSADQQELVDIGSKLGLRNQDYAFALGIGLPRLSSYIYGRTASVPDDVMKKARALFADEPLRVERLKRFNRPMSQILKEWEERLKPKNDEDLATSLGVTKMTIYRWRNDETQPDPTALARYEQWIDDFEKRFSHMIEQRLADQK